MNNFDVAGEYRRGQAELTDFVDFTAAELTSWMETWGCMPNAQRILEQYRQRQRQRFQWLSEIKWEAEGYERLRKALAGDRA